MKRLLLVVSALALAALACSVNLGDATPTPVIVAPTAVPYVAPVVPTPVPVPPKAQASSELLPPELVSWLDGNGFVPSGTDKTGENSCAASYCIAYFHSATGVHTSFYLNNGELTGVGFVMKTSDVGGPAGTDVGAIEKLAGIPQDAFEAGSNIMKANGVGQFDVPSGWRVVGKFAPINGTDYWFFMFVIPGKNVGSTSMPGQSA